MKITYRAQEFELEAGESVLDALERGGEGVPSFCRAGSCQTCVMRAVSGKVPPVAQAGLKPAWRQRGLFLACVCRPTEDMVVERTDVARSFATTIDAVERLSERVLRIWLRRPPELNFEAGQFIQLVRPSDGLMRPYSLASLPSDDRLELHVAEFPNGQLSPWLAQSEGEAMEVRGPFGECVYVSGEPERPLVLAGTGTGLAPLLGVVRAALRAEHRGTIHLIVGAKDERQLYLLDELKALSLGSENLRVTLSVLGSITQGAEPLVVEQRDIEQVLLADSTALATRLTYLCGNAELVRMLKKKLFMAGAPLHGILADAFVPMGIPAGQAPSTTSGT